MGDLLSDQYMANEEAGDALERAHSSLMVAFARVIPPDAAQEITNVLQHRRGDLSLATKKALLKFSGTAWPPANPETEANVRVTCPDCAAILDIVDGTRLKFIKHQC